MRFLRLLVLSMLVFLAVSSIAQEEERTVGALYGEHSGYTLVTPQGNPFTFLLDDQGRIVHNWFANGGTGDSFLDEEGNLYVNMARQTPIEENDFTADVVWVQGVGTVEKYNWDGDLLWSYEFNRPNYRIHHGITPMPNGNVLLIAFVYFSNEEAIAAGRNPETLGDGLWSEAILEYDPELNEIVWEWHLWDHIVQDFDESQDNFGDVGANPQLVDLNYYNPNNPIIEDWIHINALDYNAELDQIMISAREFNEIWVIDHGLTTEEATTEAGNLLYRWGNPEAYDRGTPEDRELFFHHDVQWVDAGFPGEGNMIAYSNRNILEGSQGEEFSRVVEFTPPLLDDGTYALEDGQAYAPADPTWFYQADPVEDLFSPIISGTQRLSTGNTLIIEGIHGRMIEVTPEGEIVWEYIMPYADANIVPQGGESTARIFRARRYEADYPAFEGRDLTPQTTIEDLAETTDE